VNLNTFKTSFRRVALSGVVALAMLALPSPLSDASRVSAVPFPGNSAKYKNGEVYWGCACHVDTTKPPALTSFQVWVDGVLNPVTSFRVFGAAIVFLTLTSPVYSDSDITLSYIAPDTDHTLQNNALQDKDGVDFDSFTRKVTNEGPSRPESTDSGLPSAPTPTPTPTDSGLPSWDAEPLTDSETDAFTEGIWPAVIPGNIIITNEFGFTVDKNNGIKPKIRMKNYAGKITKMTLSATYKDGSKTKKYKCVYAPFGSTKKAKTAKWKWYTPKKACVLPAPLVASIQKGTATLSAKGKWSRQWVTSAQKTRPDKTKIKARTLRYTVKGLPS
jgi:hypothetical protein